MNRIEHKVIPCSVCEKLYAASKYEINVIHNLPSHYNADYECETYPEYKM